MTARECASMLRNNRIFQSVGEDRLERLVENADMQTFRRGDEILSPSRGGRIMGMIITGSAAVNKGRAVINTLVPGDIFGAVTLFSDEPSPATTVTARVECSAVFFEKDAIAELIESRYRVRRLSFGADTLSDAQNRGSDRRGQREQAALLSARARAGRRG